jgi:hypothetical protein
MLNILLDNTQIYYVITHKLDGKLGGMDWNNVAVGRHEEIKARAIAANKAY